ncbi:DUF5791 family protein [Halorubrum lacusprofundi]|jgi:hypothetical protein|uniref:Uncharacterized protein n=1 Tax=Halorubrum lacusprofundi (strain ATCC 49239 / DSM 5036 / JCM 8891 / ACAM 34) TaxID=416348 RepID=B9LRH1_HALLT|nr:DUF5791 family protein [Halorubrum lacusprofundi]ACM55794.1 hypothetical protein Hlac_0189 [Halorubrum lacusprofundi ATCC 49239]MCG1006664.1 DUF5791 family protein [Halorubrum lacusprofundi]
MFHEVVADGATGVESGAGETQSGETEDGESTDTDEVTAAALLASFETLLSEAAAEVGRDRLVDETGLDGGVIDAAVDGDATEIRLEDGAAIVAVSTDRDGDAVVAEVRDHLLMGMATAVLDVDTIAAAIDADLTGQEVQQALEGRAPMTLGQLAEIMAVIERRKS